MAKGLSLGLDHECDLPVRLANPTQIDVHFHADDTIGVGTLAGQLGRSLRMTFGKAIRSDPPEKRRRAVKSDPMIPGEKKPYWSPEVNDKIMRRRRKKDPSQRLARVDFYSGIINPLGEILEDGYVRRGIRSKHPWTYGKTEKVRLPGDQLFLQTS